MHGLARAASVAGGMIGALLLMLALATPASAADSRSITVDPATGLSDGQVVTLAGSGFTPSTQLYVLECNSNATGASGCNIAAVQMPTSDADGSFSIADYKVAASFGDNDCTKDTCLVQVAEGPSTDAPRGTSGPLQFGAAAPASSTEAAGDAAAGSGLAYTGTRTLPMTGLGVGLVAIGGLALWLTADRRTRRTQHEH